MITEYKQQEPTGNSDRQLSDCYPVMRHVNVVSDTENLHCNECVYNVPNQYGQKTCLSHVNLHRAAAARCHCRQCLQAIVPANFLAPAPHHRPVASSIYTVTNVGCSSASTTQQSTPTAVQCCGTVDAFPAARNT
jgi:hypothetical protein